MARVRVYIRDPDLTENVIKLFCFIPHQVMEQRWKKTEINGLGHLCVAIVLLPGSIVIRDYHTNWLVQPCYALES